MRTPVSLAALILAVALAYALGHGADGDGLHLRPGPLEAGRPDSLHVPGYGSGDCGTRAPLPARAPR